MGHVFFVTIRTSFSRPIFRSPGIVKTALATLREAATRFDGRVYGYCFMPDHLHLLGRTPPDIDFLKFVHLFKQLSGLGIRQALADDRQVWQPRFYDHALRSSEGILPALRYIFENPIRAHLTNAAAEYPYSGSFEWPEMPSAGLEGPGLHTTVVLDR